MLSNIHFANPYFLFLLIIIPSIAVWYWFKHNSIKAEISFSDTTAFKGIKKSNKLKFRHSMIVMRLLAITLLIIAFARPQTSSSLQDVSIEGIDIIVAMDVSSTMLAEDFKPNRLEAAKKVGLEFIDNRPNDRIGLVVFSGEAFTQCPLTSDHSIIKNLYSDIKSGIIEDGTAIGDGLATAISRLKDSKAISKTIILLTDGMNNAGFIDPRTAAEMAKSFGIRIYTIGVGKHGLAPYPFQTPYGIQYQNMPVEIDEALLKNVANTTNGEYFRATSRTQLEKIYQQIDKMEKSKIDVQEFRKRKEEFLPLTLIAALLLTIEILLRKTIYKSLP